MVVKRATVATCNVLFPPLAVWMLTGEAGEDLLINSCLFLLAVIPSHIHGFYLSWTYFNRKRKIRRGEYPGGRRPMIYSSKVQNGGASPKEIRQFKKERDVEKKEKSLKKKQEGGRVRRLFRRILHRKGAQSEEDSYPYDTKKGYAEPNTPSYESSTIQRRTSRQPSEPLGVSRHSSRRNSYVAPIEVNDPRRRESTPRSHPPRAILQSPLVQRAGTNSKDRSHRNSMNADEPVYINVSSIPTRNPLGSRRNSVARSASSNGEALADYVARPALPQRPGSSYRDDIDKWRRSVPVEVN